MTVAILLLAAYLIGSIPFGVIVGRFRGFDPRTVGSHNIGMTNVARAGGTTAAALTFLGDALKGAIPVAFALFAGFSPKVIAATAFFAFVGAICSVFLKFRGGKGVSAALGIWIVISPPATAVLAIVFGILAASTRIISIASMCAAIALPPTVAVLKLPRQYLLLAILMTALVLFRHRENIARLISGDEGQVKPKDSRPATG
jgi:acyl phosphate:glycerol-3-phosphate acyltransferase